MGLGPIWYQIGSKTSFIPKVSKFYVGEGYLYKQALKFHHWQVNLYFTDQNIWQMGDDWNGFKVLGMPWWYKPTERAQRVGDKNGVQRFKKW